MYHFHQAKHRQGHVVGKRFWQCQLVSPSLSFFLSVEIINLSLKECTNLVFTQLPRFHFFKLKILSLLIFLKLFLQCLCIVIQFCIVIPYHRIFVTWLPIRPHKKKNGDRPHPCLKNCDVIFVCIHSEIRSWNAIHSRNNHYGRPWGSLHNNTGTCLHASGEDNICNMWHK